MTRRKGEITDGYIREQYPFGAQFLEKDRHCGLVEGAWWYGEAAPRLVTDKVAGERYVVLCFKAEDAARRCAAALFGEFVPSKRVRGS